MLFDFMHDKLRYPRINNFMYNCEQAESNDICLGISAGLDKQKQ